MKIIDFVPYKNRTFDEKRTFFVYRNIRTGLLSIKQKGLVVGHAEAVPLWMCACLVNQKLRDKVVETNVKNVHAYLYSQPVPEDFTASEDYKLIRYNPKVHAYFYDEQESPVDFIRQGMVYADGRILSYLQGGAV